MRLLRALIFGGMVSWLFAVEPSHVTWANEEVVYLITGEERTAWQKLSTKAQREKFIEQFWLRRDPAPDTSQNECKVEHYRRISHANKKYSAAERGWKTDRGRVYIEYGPPDRIEAGSVEGESWHYRWIEQLGSDIVFEFGRDHRIVGSDLEALKITRQTSIALREQLGISSAPRSFTRTDGVRPEASPKP